jgi:hypothetical protein
VIPLTFPGRRRDRLATRALHLLAVMRRPLRSATFALPVLLTARTMAVPFGVTTSVALQGPAGSYTVSEPFNLSTQADLWSQRDKVDAVASDEVSLTVLSLGVTQRASAVILTLALRAEGAPSDGSQDLLLPPLDLPFVPGASVSLPGSPALDAFLLEVLRGSGRFEVLASGTLAGARQCVAPTGCQKGASTER